jgi:hypothetical protein
MSIAAKMVRVEFPLAFYTNPLPGHVKFAKAVESAGAALRGFRIQYSKKDDDHNIFAHQISVEIDKIDGDVVNFNVFFKVRDDTASHHAFTGAVEVVVIARFLERH